MGRRSFLGYGEETAWFRRPARTNARKFSAPPCVFGVGLQILRLTDGFRITSARSRPSLPLRYYQPAVPCRSSVPAAILPLRVKICSAVKERP